MNQSDTDGIIDKTGITKVDYNQDFELGLDKNLRVFTKTNIISDPIETNNLEQAF